MLFFPIAKNHRFGKKSIGAEAPPTKVPAPANAPHTSWPSIRPAKCCVSSAKTSARSMSRAARDIEAAVPALSPGRTLAATALAAERSSASSAVSRYRSNLIPCASGSASE
ncbi:hypothetical protein [Lysobacter sp. TAB13]|uniref:hypothetical protein n=1 Tax=Lysobacter sp. TAB13 TaxID=3233065 RepID=UPI003F9AD4E5